MSRAALLHGFVKLEEVRQNNIVYADLGQPPQNSIFEQQYKMAAANIVSIIENSERMMAPQNRVCRECPRSDCRACTHRNSQGFHGGRPMPQNLTECHTAVPFIGDRGTGKTSVMCSVLERLRNYVGFDPNAAFYLGEKYDNVHFVTLDMIDAGMLKTTEDVLEIILAQMLAYLENTQNDDAFLELYQQINQLHEDLCLIREEKCSKVEEFGLTSLQRLADSREATWKFQKMVQEFLAAMSKYRFNNHPCYLVVAVDDVDMYQGSKWGMENCQFALLEHIYAHLRVPGLIVLMTFNERLLKREINWHFEEIYFGRRVKAPYTRTEEQDINALTSQFMSKLFPQEKRIYMPNYMQVDAVDRSNLYICPSLEGKLLAPFSSVEARIPAKEFMLRLIAYKTGVYFDAAGTKKHFFEPRNLRELGELFQFVYSMEDIPVKDELQGDEAAMRKERNRQRLLDYLKNQFALRVLNVEEYEMFSGLMELPLWRQYRTLIDDIRLQRQKVCKEEDAFGRIAGSAEDRWRYSYGELVHNIYFSTRIPKIRDGYASYFRKEFMQCILGTHSVQMNEAVRADSPRKDVMKVVGSSLAGRWANKMVPKVVLPGYQYSGEAGSISLPVHDYFDWEIPEKVHDAIVELCRGSEARAQKTVTDFMEALVVAGMFFTNVPSRGLGIELEPGRDDGNNPRLYLHSDSKDHLCFNVLNFAINLYNALPDDGYLNDMQRKLKKLGQTFSEKLQTDWTKKKEQSESKLMELTSEDRSRRRMFMPPIEAERENDLIMKQEQEKESAELWLLLKDCCQNSFLEKKFLRIWDTAIDAVISRYRERITAWQQVHGEFNWVLPVQHFDMMYNINKRLANISYHDIPDDAEVSDVFKHYVALYRSLEEELEMQDGIYGKDNETTKFSKRFRECVFYSAIMTSKQTGGGEEDKGYNPYIREVLVSIVSSTVRHNSTRMQQTEFKYDR